MDQKPATTAELIAGAERELRTAYARLGDAADWIRANDLPATPAQKADIARKLYKITAAKDVINEALT